MKHFLLVLLFACLFSCTSTGQKETKVEETPAEAVESISEMPSDSTQMNVIEADSLAESEEGEEVDGD